MPRRSLKEGVQEVHQILSRDVWSYESWSARHTEIKDIKRLEKIFRESEEKWVMRCNTMAQRITHTDKCMRRALAVVEAAPLDADSEKIKQMMGVFLGRAMYLNAGQIDPQDFGKARMKGYLHVYVKEDK